MTTRAEFEDRRLELANHILEHPEEFDMSTFGTKTACGTTACLAGTAALLAADKGLVRLNWCISDVSGNADLPSVTEPSGLFDLPVDTWACDYLGLPSAGIFYDDSIDDPELAVKALLDQSYYEEES